MLKSRGCMLCLEKYGQMPSAWGDSVLELEAWTEHVRNHVRVDEDEEEEKL